MNSQEKKHIFIVVGCILFALLAIILICKYLSKRNSESFGYTKLRNIGRVLRRAARKQRQKSIMLLHKNVDILDENELDRYIMNRDGKYKGKEGHRIYQEAGNKPRPIETV